MKEAKSKSKALTTPSLKKPPIIGALFKDIRSMIEEARSAVAVTVNASLTMLYWKIGKRIYQEILQRDRAEYGAQIVSSLLRQKVKKKLKRWLLI